MNQSVGHIIIIIMCGQKTTWDWFVDCGETIKNRGKMVVLDNIKD